MVAWIWSCQLPRLAIAMTVSSTAGQWSGGVPDRVLACCYFRRPGLDGRSAIGDRLTQRRLRLRLRRADRGHSSKERVLTFVYAPSQLVPTQPLKCQDPTVHVT